ncbi:hypothetical protein BD560DRAFT_304234, partial [Blakeslea trispora]
WLLESEQQAAVHGVNNLDLCAPHISKHLPLIIQRWIPTLTVEVRSSYTSLREALLGRFAMGEDEENRLLLKRLRQ